MRYLFILLFFVAIVQVKSQSVNKSLIIENQTIKVSDIPMGLPLIVKDDNKDNNDVFKFSKSDNNSYYCSSPIEPISKREQLAFKLYNSEGKQLWQKTKDNYFVMNAFIKPEANIVHTVWEKRFEFCQNCSFYQAYDLKGNLIKEIKNFGFAYVNNVGDSFYSLGKEGDRYALGYYSFADNSSWNKYSYKKFKIYAIAPSGEYILLKLEDNICLLSNTGSIIWSRPKKERYYQCSFSDNGMFYTQCNSYNDFKVFDTKSGKEIYNRQHFNKQHADKRIFGVKFLKGSSKYISIAYISGKGNLEIDVYSTDGALKDSFNYKYFDHLNPDHLLLNYNNNKIQMMIKGVTKKTIVSNFNYEGYE